MSPLQVALYLAAVLTLYGIAGHLDERAASEGHEPTEAPPIAAWAAERQPLPPTHPVAFSNPDSAQALEQEASP